jgi:uncharacterized damage-inducible protein DinB
MTDPDPLRVFRKLAQMNRLANLRLQGALRGLSAADYSAPRPSFFGSVRAAMNHIPMVDVFYINALSGVGLDPKALDRARNCADLAGLITILWRDVRQAACGSGGPQAAAMQS